MSDQDERQHMLECEARYWLRRGKTTPEKVAELKETHLNKRGEQAVTRLIEEMRKQWRRRHEWLGRENG
ncbi:MAG: hypothetical protein Q7T99_17355 [Pseudomonas sp.]|nr:hypothetical protein [Pseudomonas sp.]